MNRKKLIAIILPVFLTACAAEPTIQTGEDAEVTFDGLTRVDNTVMSNVWLRADADLTGFRKIMLMSAGIEFRPVGNTGGTTARRSSSNEFPISEDNQEMLKEIVGEAFRSDLRAAGVGFDVPGKVDGLPTARCLIQVTPDAQRTLNTYLGVSAHLSPDEIDDALVASASHLYCEGYLWDMEPAKAAIRRAMDVAAGAGRTVSLTLSDSFCVNRHRDERFWRSIHHPLIAFPIGRAQVFSQNLAAGVARQRIDQVDAARAFEGGDALARPGDDISFLDAGAGLGHNDRLHRLAPFLVGNPDHRDLLHRRMAEDRAFDLGRFWGD